MRTDLARRRQLQPLARQRVQEVGTPDTARNVKLVADFTAVVGPLSVRVGVVATVVKSARYGLSSEGIKLGVGADVAVWLVRRVVASVGVAATDDIIRQAAAMAVIRKNARRVTFPPKLTRFRGRIAPRKQEYSACVVSFELITNACLSRPGHVNKRCRRTCSTSCVSEVRPETAQGKPLH